MEPDSRSRSQNVASEDEGYLAIIIFGASGDLAKKKIFPALFSLYCQGFLPHDKIHIFGYARSALTDKGLRDQLNGFLKMGGKTTPSRSFSQLQRFLSLAILYQEKLRAGKNGQTGRIFYLALPPSIYLQVSRNIKEHCMNVCGWNRIVIEKPFGKDLASSNQLNGQLGKLFAEEEIYRIDHYLGKEAVQNLLVLRFANHIFQPLWNRDHIDNVQIVFKEDFGTEGRGGYFDEYGIVRDIIQNHLIQVLCLMAMEKPASLSPECIRDEKLKVLKSMKPINHEEVVLGQYNGYLDDSTVPKDSNTPTFASVILRIHNERWDGVPFIIKAGKALDSRKAEIRVQFKDVAGDIYRSQRQGRNEFVIRLQPSEAMYMKFTVKKPGLDMSTTQSEMDLSFLQRYEGVIIPEAYERLFLDIVRGDQQHFVRRDELEAAWQIFTPLLHAIEKGEFTSVIYPQGSRGPPEADQLAERAGYVQTHGYIWIPPSLMSRV